MKNILFSIFFLAITLRSHYYCPESDFIVFEGQEKDEKKTICDIPRDVLTNLQLIDLDKKIDIKLSLNTTPQDLVDRKTPFEIGTNCKENEIPDCRIKWIINDSTSTTGKYEIEIHPGTKNRRVV